MDRMKVTFCPNCGYRAKNDHDPLLTKYGGKGECPSCMIIVENFIKKQQQDKRQATEQKTTEQTNSESFSHNNKTNQANGNTTSLRDDSIDPYNFLNDIIHDQDNLGVNFFFILIPLFSFLGYLLFSTFNAIIFGGFLGGFASLLMTEMDNNQPVMHFGKDLPPLLLIPIMSKLTSNNKTVFAKEEVFVKKYIDNSISNQHKEISIKIFINSLADNHSIYEYSTIINELFKKDNIDSSIRLNLYSYLYGLAYESGGISESNKIYLLELAEFFILTDSDFDKYKKNITGESIETKKNTLEKYYNVLNCSNKSSIDDIKRSFREKSLKFHPDVISSKQLPPEFIQFAENQFYLIKEAYDVLMKEHIRR